MKPTDPSWRERHGHRLVSPEEAVGRIAPGSTIWTGGWTSVPVQLCNAIASRAELLHGSTILGFLNPVNWDRPELLTHLRVVNFYAGPADRAAVREGRFDYVPLVQWRHGQIPPGLDGGGIDVACVPISPPDEDGFCSFGAAVWFSPTITRRAKLLIGEVHPEFIRTGGENRIHISRFAALSEYTLAPVPPPIPPRSEETELAANVICTLVASEIVKDGDTVQFGIGDVSAALPIFLSDKRDLGVHTELLPGGIVDLVKQGAITGRRKPVGTGKVVASAAAQLTAEEYAFIDGNETFEFHDFTYTDDLRTLLQFENFVAVNNAMAVDITGNVASETQGNLVFSGPGGQFVFAVGASTAAGGSVIVLPSSSLVGGERRSRIVGGHPEGTVITVHRGYVDYVVTEQGIARLRGKSVRERVDELISVSDPDFRGQLRAEAKRLYGVSA